MNETPADHVVEDYLAPALIAAADCVAMFPNHPQAIALAARRFIGQFPGNATADQIDAALRLYLVLPTPVRAQGEVARG